MIKSFSLYLGIVRYVHRNQFPKTNLVPKTKHSSIVPSEKRLSELNEVEMEQMNLKQFSVKVHRHLISKNESRIDKDLIWPRVQYEFLKRLQITTDPVKIRSYSKIIYSLSKAKQSSMNYENKLGIMLPFASPQSFTMIVMSISRMGPLSRQFGYIVAKLYTKRKAEFNIREKVQLNYVIARNGYEADSSLIQAIDSMNLKQIALMLRSFDCSDCMKESHLKIAERAILARKNQMNILDLADLINIYFKYLHITPQLESLFTEMYSLLKRNIDEVIFKTIWEYFPQVINQGKLQINFVKEVIKTIRILKKAQKFSQDVWNKLKKSFPNVLNLQLRVELEKIS